MRRLKKTVIATCILMMLTPVTSFGAVKTIPDSSVTVGNTVRLSAGRSNYTAVWGGGVAGKTVTTETGKHALMIPIKDIDGAWSYSNFLDVTFKNAGSISGRSIDFKMHFNSVSVQEAYNKNKIRTDKHMCVMQIDDMQISGIYSSGVGYPAAAVYDITVTVVWSDTQQVVNLPFFMAAIDLDAGNDYFKEGWEAISGFTGNYYIYKENILNISGTKFMSTAAETTSGNDMYLKTGVYASTTNGSFRMKYYEGNCGTIFMLYSQYQLLGKPVKTIR